MDKHRWQRIQELFLAVESLADEQRQRYLEQVCPNPELRQEVLSLLQADDQAENFLQPVLRHQAEQPLSQGSQIGPYQIENLLGQGGMGSVYLAQDTRLHRAVALKFLSDKYQKKSIYHDRFLVEARAASRLDHINICTIFDIGETEQAQPYIAMAYYPGDTLDRLIKRPGRRPATEQALDIVSQILRGIFAAHQQGILHRDLKPANIIITPDKVVKILDFGVAKISGIDITTTGNQVGTIAYMSPEQLQGGEAGVQADIWSCGVILYELLVGQRPFQGKENHHVMYAILHKQFTPPKQANPDLPDELARILERMLCHELELRYPSAQAVLNDLARYAGNAEAIELPEESSLSQTDLDTVNIRSQYSSTATFNSDGDIRQATVMSIDLCSYAQLLQDIGTDNTEALVEEFFKRMGRVIENYGGIVNRVIDNTVIAIFGVPKAHDNDARRAVHAAFACHAAVQTLGLEQQRTLSAHIGIANGIVLLNSSMLAQSGKFSITGDSLNLATRLDDLAQPNEILISDSLYQITRQYFDCEHHGTVTTRHQKEPITVWQVTAARDNQPQTLNPIFGRRGELQQFSYLLSMVNNEQRGHIVYVCGEAGIGKTRLASEYRELADTAGFATHQGLILDFGVSQEQGAIASVVRSLLQINPALNDESVALNNLVKDGEVLAAEIIAIKELLAIPMSADEQMIFDLMEHSARLRALHESLLAIIQRRAVRQPQLLFFEDLHWADAHIMECITFLAASIQDLPVILLLTTRPENEPLTPTWRNRLNNTPLATFYLTALHEQDATDMARSLADDQELDCSRLIKKSQGNPLFLEQLIRNTEPQRLDTISDNLVLPATLQSLVQSRLDKLDTADKNAARAASIIGQRFTTEQLRFLLDDPAYNCQHLVDQQLTHQRGNEFLFNHALIHEGIYASLLDSHKQELHKRAADWFRERDRPLAAEHLDRAHSADAPAAYLDAAIEQKAHYHFDQAQRLIDKALEIADQKDQTFALQSLRGDVLADLGDITQAEEAYRTALESAVSDDQRCRAWIGIAQCHDINDEHEQVLSALEHAEQAAQQHQLLRELAQIHYQRGNLYFPQGHIEACRNEHQQAIDYARKADSPRHEAQALSGLGDAEYAAGRMLSAHEYFLRCLQLCRQYGYARIESANKFMLGTVRIYMNELNEALQDSLDSADTASKVGHVRAEIVSRLTAGWILLEGLRLDEANEQIERGLQLTEQLGARRFAPFLNESKVRLLLARGQHKAAFALAKQALQETRDTGSLPFIGPWVLGALALASTDPAIAEKAMIQANELLDEGCVGHNYYQFYRAAIEYSLRHKKWQDALHYTQKLSDYTRDEPNPWSQLHCHWGQTLANAALNPQDKNRQADLQQLKAEAEAAGFLARAKLIEELQS